MSRRMNRSLPAMMTLGLGAVLGFGLFSCSSDTPATNPPGAGGTSGGTAPTAGTGGSGNPTAGTGGTPGVGGTGGSGTAGAPAGGTGGSDMGGSGGTAGDGVGGTGGDGVGGTGGSGGSGGGAPVEFAISGDFEMMGDRLCHKDGQTRLTNGPFGTNKSPELNWVGVPAGTMSLAVTLKDLTNNGVHWVMCNIPPDVTGLPADISDGNEPEGSEWAGDGSGNWYGPGAGDVHEYEYKVWALDVAELPGGCDGNKSGVYDDSLPDAEIDSVFLLAYGNSDNDCE